MFVLPEIISFEESILKQRPYSHQSHPILENNSVVPSEKARSHNPQKCSPEPTRGVSLPKYTVGLHNCVVLFRLFIQVFVLFCFAFFVCFLKILLCRSGLTRIYYVEQAYVKPTQITFPLPPKVGIKGMIDLYFIYKYVIFFIITQIKIK